MIEARRGYVILKNMKHKFLLGLLALAALPGAVSRGENITAAASMLVSGATDHSTQFVSAHDSKIIYEGRFATEQSGAVQLAFPGVTAHLRFRGPALTVWLNAAEENLYFDVSIDGAAPTPLPLRKGEGSYTLLAGTTVAEHTVALIRRNESWHGMVTLTGFDPGPGGELLAAPALPPRKLLFIGDSVTCGEMAAYEPGRDMKDHLNWGPRVTYGMVVARRFGAQCHLVSCGGRGLVRDWQGVRSGINAPQFYELALPDVPAARWDHSQYVPDAIGIELGQNDFSQGVPDQIDYVNAYVQFIEKLRRDAPQAVIFLMQSAMQNDGDPVGDPRRAALLAYLTQVVARCHTPKVLLAPVRHYPGVPGNTHPTGAEHAAMADELEPLFRRALGW